MKTKRDKLKNYDSHNRLYNNSIKLIVEKIFTSERIGVNGYIESDNFFDSQLLNVIPDELIVSFVNESKNVEFNNLINQMGKSEQILLSSLAFGSHTIYTIVGEAGSGKTAICEEVLKRLKKCGRFLGCTHRIENIPIIFSINFNEGFNQKNSHKLLKHFREEFYEKLYVSIYNLMDAENVIDPFIEYIKDPKNENAHAKFFDYYHDISFNWEGTTKFQKKEKLFEFVKSISENGKTKGIYLLSHIAKFIKDIMTMKESCFIYFLDNIDRIKPEVQQDILMDIITTQEISQVRTLIPLRITSYENLDLSGLVIKVILHNGATPVKVCMERIKHYLENSHQEEYENIISNISSDYLKIFDEELMKFTKYDKHDRVADALKLLSETNLRRGLELCQRLFMNTAIPFDEEEVNQNNYIRCMITQFDKGSSCNRLKEKDVHIANIFKSPTDGYFSWILIRILMLIQNHETEERNYTIRNLIQDLKLIKRWENEDIFESINYLLISSKNLIRIDGKSKYKDIGHMYESGSDHLEITDLGRNYINKLVKELNYLQEATMECDWLDNTGIPVKEDYSKMLHRFRLVRIHLNEMIRQDQEEYLVFENNLKVSNRMRDYKLYLISSKILNSITSSFINIFYNYDYSSKLDNEISLWKSLMINTFNKEKDISGEENHYIDLQITELEKFHAHFNIYKD